MRERYDFSKAKRGVHAAQYAAGVKIIVDGQEVVPAMVVLEPNVSAAFPDSRAVNEALRLLIKTAKSAQEFAKAS